jgi:hypothetical protein
MCPRNRLVAPQLVVLFSHLVGAQQHFPPSFGGAGSSGLGSTAASAALGRRDVAGRDLVLVGGKGCQDFGLLAFRDLGEVQRPSKFGCNLIEFGGGNPEIAVSLLQAERRLAGLGGGELEGPTRNVADPQRAHELEAGQPFQVLSVPFPQLWVLGLLADDGVLHDGVAEMIHYRRDGEYPAQPLIQTFLRRGSFVVSSACA